MEGGGLVGVWFEGWYGGYGCGGGVRCLEVVVSLVCVCMCVCVSGGVCVSACLWKHCCVCSVYISEYLHVCVSVHRVRTTC